MNNSFHMRPKPPLFLSHTHTYTHHRNRNEELHQTLTTKRPCCCVSFFFYLSKSSRSRKTPTARGKAYIKCPSRGYSTPGGGRSRSAHVTFSGNQNLSLQIQAEMQEVIWDQEKTKRASLQAKRGEISCRTSGGRGVLTETFEQQ